MDEPETIQFACPKCGGEGPAELIDGLLFADHYEPCLQCCECGTAWRVSLYEVEDADGNV